jgi:hypothetical protein
LVCIGSFRFAGTGVISPDLAHVMNTMGDLMRLRMGDHRGWVLPSSENCSLRAVRSRSAASWALGQAEFGLAFSLFQQERR